jgi:dihydroflavonol-4-reductase
MNLVTGATGHIGNVLIGELAAKGESVRAFVLPGEETSWIEKAGVEIVRGNVLDYASLLAAMQGVDTVFHLAGIISILPGPDPHVWQVNVEGTRNVLAAMRHSGARRLVYASSIHALERPPHGITIDETLKFDPQNTAGEYDRSKAAASLLVHAAAAEGMDAVIICPTGVIGPYDFINSEMGGLIHGWMKRRLHFLVDGAYDFVDVRDIAHGMILAAQKGRRGETYILSGERIQLVDLHKLVEAESGRKAALVRTPWWAARLGAVLAPWLARLTRSKPVFTPYSLETVRSNSIITRGKAALHLGYAPRAMKQTVIDTVRWWRERKPVRLAP